MLKQKLSWEDAFLAGDIRSLSRAISCAENEPALAQAFLGRHGRRLGKAHIIGITGPPGAGKSTLTGQLAAQFAARGYSLGLLLVDPASPFTGGAILGDRLRLPDLTDNSRVYVRSMSSRGSMGGLARAANDAIKLLDLFGKDIILVETVGTGQAETDVIRVVDSVVVVAVPGLGDDVQAMKAGILEIADLFVVNKADREGAAKTQRELSAMLKLQPESKGWEIPVLSTVAIKNEGISRLADALQAHYQYLQASGILLEQRTARIKSEVTDLLRFRFFAELKQRLGSESYDGELAEKVAAGELSVYDAAGNLWDKVIRSFAGNNSK